MTTRSSQVFVTLIILFTVVLLMFAGSSATAVHAANTTCKKVSGHVAIEPVPCPTSLPDAVACGAGTVKGDIRGTVFVVNTWYTPSPDTPTTGYLFMTADAVFDTPQGTITTKDAITLSPMGGEYAEVDTIIGGTGSYANATGTLVATGTSDATGAKGSYSGKICVP